jgi:hypothetical protein
MIAYIGQAEQVVQQAPQISVVVQIAVAGGFLWLMSKAFAKKK